MDKASTINKILKHALAEFAVHGVDGISGRQISKEAGVNHASINYYFGSKQEMYLELVRRAVEYFEDRHDEAYSKIASFLKEKNPSKERAVAYIKELLNITRKDISAESFASFQLLVRREEIFPTDAFGVLYENVVKPYVKATTALIKIARDDISQEQATAMATLFMTMNLAQVHCKEGIVRSHNKTTFDADLEKLYFDSADLIIDNFLK
ncbi:MAG: CerR family C-terminal domain-containing protein [Opitutales bacterium]